MKKSTAGTSTLRKIFGLLSDAAVYGTSSVLSQALALFLLPILSDYLTPEDFGLVAMLTVLTTLFVPLANLGMSNSIFRRFSTCRDDAERTNVLTIGLVSIVIASVSLCVLGMFWSGWLSSLLTGSPDYRRLVNWSLLSATFNSIGVVGIVVLRADRRVKSIAVLNIVKLLVSAAATLFFLFAEGMKAEGIILGTLAGDAVGMVASFGVTFRRFKLTIHDSSMIRPMLSYGLPFLPTQLQTLGLTLLGQYIIRAFLGLDAAGLYNVAFKLAVPLAFVVDSVHKAWVPYKFHIYAHDENPKYFFRTVVTYYSAGITYLWLGVCVWGPEALRLLTNPSFHAAAPLVPFIASIALARGIRFMVCTGMELGEDMRALPVASFLGLIATTIGCAVMIPLFGIPGAALATTLAWVVMAAVLFVVSQKVFPISYDWPVVSAMLVISCVLVAIDCAAQYALDWPARVALATAFSLLYPVVALAILFRSATERARMTLLLSKIRALRGTRKQRTQVSGEQAYNALDHPTEDGVSAEPSAAAAEPEASA